LISQLPSASAARHCTYIGRGVSFRTVGCSFLSAGGTGGESGFGWRHFSVGDNSVPEYSESIGDYFASDVNAAIITNENFVTEVIGATIHVGANGTGITVSGPSRISGCHIVGDTGAGNGITDGSFAGGQATIQDTLIEGDFAGYGIYRVHSSSDLWQVGPNVKLAHTSVAAGGIRNRGGAMDLSSVIFDNPAGGTAASMFITGGTVRMANVRHLAGCKYMVVSPTDANVALEFQEGNVWEDNGSQPLVTPDGVHGIVFKGQPTFFESSAGAGDGLAISGAPGSTISGQMQCGRGVGAYTYASNVLTVNWNYSAYPVNEGGTPTIKNINMKGGIGVGVVASDHIKAGSPRITLLAQRAFSLDNSGNVALASSPLSVPVNTSVDLQWFPALAKWYAV
jgi:hypothetical protein